MSLNPPASQGNAPQVNKSMGLRRGCLLLLSPFIAIYVVHALFLIIPNNPNQVRWHNRGSTDYTFTVTKSGLLPLDILQGRIVVVRAGVVESVANVSLAEPVYTADIETINEMFDGVYSCSLLFPLLGCSYKYDAELGYPAEITVNCPIPDACYTHTSIKDLRLVAP